MSVFVPAEPGFAYCERLFARYLANRSPLIWTEIQERLDDGFHRYLKVTFGFNDAAAAEVRRATWSRIADSTDREIGTLLDRLRRFRRVSVYERLRGAGISAPWIFKPLPAGG